MGSIGKALGGVLKTAAPFANFIPGAQGWMGPAAGLLGGALDGGGGGGGKKKSSMNAQQMALIQQYMLPLLRDPGASAAAFDRDAFGQAAQRGQSLGSLIAEQTGNPNAAAATHLGQMNRATEASNQFRMQAFSPQSQAGVANEILGAMSGVRGQSMQQDQINRQFGQPTFANQLFGAAGNILPWMMQQQRPQPVPFNPGYNNSSNNVGGQGLPYRIG